MTRFRFRALAWLLLALPCYWACRPSSPAEATAEAPKEAAAMPQNYSLPLGPALDTSKRYRTLNVVLFRNDTLLTQESLWYLTDTLGANYLLGASFYSGNFPVSVYDVHFSATGRYGALMMYGEGHPWIEVFAVPPMLNTKQYETLDMLNPYPGSIEIVRWEGDELLVDSDMPMDNMSAPDTNLYNRMGEKFDTYAYNPATKKMRKWAKP